MKNKKIIMYLSIIILVIFIIIIGVIILNNKNALKNEVMEEYIPEEEISEEQLRKTNITLYFVDTETGEISAEIRQIDSKELLENPGKRMVEFLLEGPINNKLKKIIPENTKLIDTQIEKGILIINFSEDFIKENLEENEEKKAIESITKTVSQLTEINAIKILINGEENKGFTDSEINFNKKFIINNE